MCQFACCRVRQQGFRGSRSWRNLALAVATLAALASPALAAPLGLEWYSALDGDADALVGDYDGVLTGTTATTDRDGNANSALAFDGNDVVTINKLECTEFEAGTISAWVKFGSTSGTQGIVAVGAAGSTSADQYFDIIQQAGYRFDVDNGYNRKDAVAGNPDTDWHHVAATFVAGGGGMALYVDGVLQDTDTTDATTSSIIPNKNWLIGDLRSGEYYFQGSIDDVSIWSVALPESDVQILADGGSPLSVPEPSTIVMLLVGAAGLLGWRRRRTA